MNHAERVNQRKIDQERNNLALKVTKSLYKNINGSIISNNFRKQLPGESTHLTYGEIVPESFMQILDLCDIKNGNFVDLGCGTGKSIIIAALSSHRFKSVWGIEIIPELVENAKNVVNKLEALINFTDKSDFLLETKQLEDERLVLNTKDVKASCDELELINCAVNIILSTVDKFLECNELANRICSNLGHKKYKKLLKPYKTFLSFICLNDTIFSKESIDKSLIISSLVSESFPIPEKKKIDRDNDKILLDSILRETAKSLLPLPSINLENGDIFEVNWWEDADIVYVASLLFSDEMIQKLSYLALKMKIGSKIISLRPLIDDMNYRNDFNTSDDKKTHGKFKLINESFFKMSWQMARVYIYVIE